MKRNVTGLLALLFGVLVGSSGCALGIIEGVGALENVAANGIRAYAPDAPVPADTQFISPAADIPNTISAFAGAWSGVWDRDRKWYEPDKDGERRSHLLAVEEITSHEKANVVFSNGESQTRVRWQPVRAEKWKRAVGKFRNDGTLVVKAFGATAMYRLNADGKTLNAELTKPGVPTLRATLHKLDLAEFQKQKKEASAK